MAVSSSALTRDVPSTPCRATTRASRLSENQVPLVTLLTPNAKVQPRANEMECERSELPKIARLLQRIVR